MASNPVLVDASTSATYRIVTFGRSQLKERVNGTQRAATQQVPDLANEIADSAFLASLLSCGDYDLSDFEEYRPGGFEGGFFSISRKPRKACGQITSYLLEFEVDFRRFSIDVPLSPPPQVLQIIKNELGLSGITDFTEIPIDLSHLLFKSPLQLAYVNFPKGLKLDNSEVVNVTGCANRLNLYFCSSDVDFNLLKLEVGDIANINNLYVKAGKRFSFNSHAWAGDIYLRYGAFGSVNIDALQVGLDDCLFGEEIVGSLDIVNITASRIRAEASWFTSGNFIVIGSDGDKSLSLSKCCFHFSPTIQCPYAHGDPPVANIYLVDCRFEKGPLLLKDLHVFGSISLKGSYFGQGFSLDGCSFVDWEHPTNQFKDKVLWLEDISFGSNSNAPTFYAAKMPERVYWGDLRKWPVPNGHKNQSASQIFNSYQYLKTTLASSHHYWEERELYRLEMLCRLRSEGLEKKIPNYIFKTFSDYGLSAWYPAQFLFAIWFVFSHIFALAIAQGDATASEFGIGMKLSASSILGPFGMRREIFTRDEIVNFGGWVHFLMGVESILGIILIFLIGLALRNQFKMKT